MESSIRVLLLALLVLAAVLPAWAAGPQLLPWQREVPLREAAKAVFLTNRLNPTDPLPDWACYPKGQAMAINNLKMRTTLWGTPDRVTVSLMKNNVWDRRINPRGLTAPTLQEIVDGAFDPANASYAGVAANCQRPKRYGYPLLREMALFYAAYAKKGADGYYHIIPSMEPEKWGWYGGLARNQDVISSLCMFRWALNRAAEAAETLGVDADLRAQWRQVAANLAPYPTWDTPEGPVFCAIKGVEPVHVDADHFGEAPQYPTILSDDINLDSPREQKQTMLRTAKKLSTAGTTAQTRILLGQPATSTMWKIFDAESLLNSRSGRIHLFPAVAPGPEVAFRNFQARGAFLVSAAKNASEVYFLEVQARRDGACRIMNPWPGEPVVVREAGKPEPVAVTMDKSNGECLEFPAAAGKKYSIASRPRDRR